MAYTYTNNTFTNGADVLFQFKEALKASGWTVLASGNGTSYNSSGDNITTNSLMAVARSWFVISAPGATNGFVKQLSFQNSATVSGSNGLNIRIKYSYGAGFSGGSPSATVVSSAADETIITGGGTDASPTFNSWGGGAQSSLNSINRNIFIIGDASEGYSFISWTIQRSGSTGNLSTSHSFLMDKVENSNNDQDPYVLFLANSGAWTFFSSNGTLGPYCWWKKNSGDQRWARVYGLINKTYNLSGTVDGNIGPDPWTGRDKLLPVFYASDTSTYPDCGKKGTSHLLKISTSSYQDGYTSTYNSGSRIAIWTSNTHNYMTVPWNGTTTSLV